MRQDRTGKRIIRIRKPRTCTQCHAYLPAGSQVVYYNERHIYGVACHSGSKQNPQQKLTQKYFEKSPSIHGRRPFCKEEFSVPASLTSAGGADSKLSRKSCPKCSTLHHTVCWVDAGGCAVFGCSEARKITRTNTVQPVLATAWSLQNYSYVQTPSRAQVQSEAVVPRSRSSETRALLVVLMVASYFLFCQWATTSTNSSQNHALPLSNTNTYPPPTVVQSTNPIPIPYTSAYPSSSQLPQVHPSLPQAPVYIPPDYSGYSYPQVAENGSYYGQISTKTGAPKTTYVHGYFRKNGTYVRSYYRSH